MLASGWKSPIRRPVEKAESSFFYPDIKMSDIEKAAKVPSNEYSLFQAKAIQDLQGWGVQFLSCHTAAEEQAHPRTPVQSV